jgi:glycosyltransferase involved in cell wall biosynthesis
MKEAKRKILIYVHSLEAGGAERVSIDLANMLQNIGNEILLVTNETPEKDFYTLNATIGRESLKTSGSHKNPFKRFEGWVRRKRRLRKLIAKENPAAIIAMMNSDIPLATISASKTGVPVIGVEHCHPDGRKQRWILKQLIAYTYPRLNALVVLTKQTEEWFRNNGHNGEIEVIENALRWPIEGSQPYIPVPKHNGSNRIILSVGRLEKAKRFDRLIDSFSNVQSLHPDWKLVIIGEGTQRSEIQLKIKERGQQGNIELKGRVGNIGEWYASADIFALASEIEGFPLSLAEAMASGCACISYDCPTGPKEMIIDGENGLLIPNDETDVYSSRLSELMQSSVARKRLGENATSIRDKLSPAAISVKWARLIDKVVSENNRKTTGETRRKHSV